MEEVNAYEQERMARIQANQARLAELGIKQQATLLESALRFKVQRLRTPSKAKSCPVTPARTSARLAKTVPEFKGLADDFVDGEACGRMALPKSVVASEQDQRWKDFVSERRCDSKSRGSIYDSVAGICCHFCRQKKLCGEADCARCSARDPSLPCRGKSECTRCGAATGRFCRACLNVRYGERLEDVRAAMAAGAWLCPHCYEADHPGEGWICNSSICMTKRGLKPTGIAIFEAQGKGFVSVGHYVQAQLLHHRQARRAPTATAQAAPPADAAVTITVAIGTRCPAGTAPAGKPEGVEQGAPPPAVPELLAAAAEPGEVAAAHVGAGKDLESDPSVEGPPTPRAAAAALPNRAGSADTDAAVSSDTVVGKRAGPAVANGAASVVDNDAADGSSAALGDDGAAAGRLDGERERAAVHVTPTKRSKTAQGVALVAQGRLTRQRSAASTAPLPAFAPDTAPRVTRSSRRLQA